MATRQELIDQDQAWLLRSSFLYRLPPEDQDAVLAAMEPRAYEAGDGLARAGARCEGMHLLVTGQAAIWRAGTAGQKRALAHPGPGELIGQVELHAGSAHAHDIGAAKPIAALYMEAAAYRELRRICARFAEQMDSQAELAARRGEILDLLRRQRLLRSFPPDDLELMLLNATFERPQPQEVVLRAGEINEDYFLVLDGRLAAHEPDARGHAGRRLQEIPAGELVGLATLFEEGPRHVMVTAGKSPGSACCAAAARS
jgi:CRP-like cAMP-binding protein